MRQKTSSSASAAWRTSTTSYACNRRNRPAHRVSRRRQPARRWTKTSVTEREWWGGRLALLILRRRTGTLAREPIPDRSGRDPQGRRRAPAVVAVVLQRLAQDPPLHLLERG